MAEAPAGPPVGDVETWQVWVVLRPNGKLFVGEYGFNRRVLEPVRPSSPAGRGRRSSARAGRPAALSLPCSGRQSPPPEAPMPIRAERKALYPADWPAISRRVREAAGWRCEWCPAEQGSPHPVTGSKVVLTVAHLDHDETNCAEENLKALCQRCHNAYDAPVRRRGTRERQRAKLAIGDLL